MHRRRALPLGAALVALALVVSCSDAEDGAADRRPSSSAPGTTPTTEPSTTTSTTAPPRLALGDGLPASAVCPATAPLAAPDPDRPAYRMDIVVDLTRGVVEGDLTVRFTPDLPVDRLVFRLWPNGPRAAQFGTRLDVGPVRLGRQRHPVVTESPESTTLVVPLGRVRRPGRAIEATMTWALTLPGPAADRISRSGDSVRLGSFFPLLAWEPGVGWALDPTTGVFGEASTSPVADVDYAVTVPAGLSVLGTGELVEGRWKASGVRDIGLSVGRFRLAEAVAAAPSPVHVVVGVHEGVDADPTAYRDRVVEALQDLSARFGDSPWPSFTLALTPELPGGIEYPCHVMQGPGTIGRTTAHEVGHQWFYALVGNDQGRDPVLDEGLATWAEARVDGTLDTLAATSVPAEAAGRAGLPMSFWETRRDAYYRGVYVQGAQALAARGDPEQVDCALRAYVAAKAFGIATTVDLVGALAARIPGAGATLARFGVPAPP
ncbi:M1 family metallopeptidase [soil metagenome]